jgi:site-specific DNA-cytosine methylase
MTPPLLLELFCGTHSVGREFLAADWEVFSIDIDPSRNATWTGDVRDFDPATLPRRPDMIWASPVCQHYSCARTKAKTPRDLEWKDGEDLSTDSSTSSTISLEVHTHA